MNNLEAANVLVAMKSDMVDATCNMTNRNPMQGVLTQRIEAINVAISELDKHRNIKKIDFCRCPWCESDAKVHTFISKIVELPTPKRLFGKWSLLKMRYKDIPIQYCVECSAFCEGFAKFSDVCCGNTIEEATIAWNEMVNRIGWEIKMDN